MQMHNPTPPGEFFKRVYLDELKVSARKAADLLEVSPSTVTRFINGQSRLTLDLATRLESAFGRTAQSWLNMQHSRDDWELSKMKRPKLNRFQPISMI